jgi:hypothetical protein
MKSSKPTLGEFYRFPCQDCGHVFEIPDPRTNDQRPDVRVYFGVCPRCHAPHIHAIGASEESCNWAIAELTDGQEWIRAPSQGVSGAQQTGRETSKHH